MIAAMSVEATYLSPFEQTALQIAAARAQAAFRSRHRQLHRDRLISTDRLLDELERARLQGGRKPAPGLRAEAARIADEVDHTLSRRLAMARGIEELSAGIFDLQDQLLKAARAEAQAGPAEVIPLFSGS